MAMSEEKLRTLGPKEAMLILGLLADGQVQISRQDATLRMKTSLGSADQILRRLVAKGWLSKAGSGLYLAQPAELGSHAMPDGEAYAMLAASEPDAVVAYGTAASLWQLTTQLRHDIIAVSPKRSWNRDLGPATLRRIHRTAEAIGSDVVVRSVRGQKVRVFSLERTALDCLSRPDLCGGADESREILAAAVRRWDWAKARSLLESGFSVATRQRLGHSIDSMGLPVPEEFRTWLATSIPTGARLYLSPNRVGRYDSRWKVIA